MFGSVVEVFADLSCFVKLFFVCEEGIISLQLLHRSPMRGISPSLTHSQRTAATPVSVRRVLRFIVLSEKT